ncbi:MAG: LLM class flavin-dependent oxidoreductase [Conexivisphaerales archaeon]
MKPLFGVNINPDSKHIDDSFAIAKLADLYGLDMIGMQDHPYNPNFLDTWTFLTALAMSTKMVHLMINVADLPLRPPAMLAKAVASLDLITKGRIELGMGAGAFWDGIESLGGIRREPKEAVDAFEEALKIIKLLLNTESSQQQVSFIGRYYSLKNAQFGPKPYHAIRIWVGGYGARMLKLTGQLADGWTISLPYLPAENIPSKKMIIEQSAKEAKREPSSIIVNYNFGGLIVNDNYKHATSSANVIIATVNEWVDILQYFYRLGINSFNFWPAGKDKIAQSELFAKEVVPRAKRSFASVA